MANNNIQKLYSRIIILIIPIIFFTILLTGCSDLVEIQDRDFVLSLGVSIKDDKYQFTFGLPDLSALAKVEKSSDENENNGQVRTYESIAIAEIEDLYNHGSNKRLDYSHLDALILDESISTSPNKLLGLFEYVDNNYQISRDVRVFYYSEDVKKLIEEKGKMKGSIGDYLEKLEKNNQRKYGFSSVTLGNLIDSFYQRKDILIPIIDLKDNKIEVESGAIFQDSIYKKTLNNEELRIYYILKGQGKEYNFHTNNKLVFKLKEFKTKVNYKYINNQPVIYFTITGTADILSEKSEDMAFESEINNYLTDAINTQINICLKAEKLDYLNLYDLSSLKNRDIWLYYENRRDDFIDDVYINVDVKITIQ